MTALTDVKHPAKFSAPIVDYLSGALATEVVDQEHALAVLDPFAGVGGVHALASLTVRTLGIELEEEWAATHERTLQGDATHLPPEWTAMFDVVVTSPAYGNRLADSYDGRDGSRRMTYRLALGRSLSPRSGAALQWGEPYRQLHRLAWHEVHRVLKPGGLFLLNVKNHYRKGRLQPVVEWHLGTVAGMGFDLEHVERIVTAGNRFGANGQVRVDHEIVAHFRRCEVGR